MYLVLDTHNYFIASSARPIHNTFITSDTLVNGDKARLRLDLHLNE